MKRELELWQFIAAQLKQNRSVILLVVAESKGSSPGRVGFKMAVAENDLRGSIGGGVMEVNLVERARFKIQDSGFKINSGVVRQNHKKNSANPSGMICSGEQTIIFYKLNFRDLPAIRQVIHALRNHQSKVLQITSNNFEVIENQSNDFDFCFGVQSENEFLFQEKLGFKNKLFIVGGGHCALALSELASKMDFHISLFDDRSDLNTLAKNRFVHEKTIFENYEKIRDFIPSGEKHFVVVMTLGYLTDEIVIRALLDKDFKYFGVLGSKAKMATLLKNLKREGFPEEKLNKIYTPIGLQINSRTPEEIAVSIAAEIIAVKNATD
jgi:xanthine dehydrogenase accessory factor